MVKREKKAPKIDIFRAWCKGCGICAAFCPKQALALDETGHPYVANVEECRACGLCELRCPDFAITVRGGKDDKDLEAREKTGS